MIKLFIIRYISHVMILIATLPTVAVFYLGIFHMVRSHNAYTIIQENDAIIAIQEKLDHAKSIEQYLAISNELRKVCIDDDLTNNDNNNIDNICETAIGTNI